jgi:hypothetical protein
MPIFFLIGTEIAWRMPKKAAGGVVIERGSEAVIPSENGQEIQTTVLAAIGFV